MVISQCNSHEKKETSDLLWKQVNKSVKRELFMLPMVEDNGYQLTGAIHNILKVRLFFIFLELHYM